MFESLTMAPPDAILGLAEAFRADTHPEKINLTVGVYKDNRGATPVLTCVKEAERRILESELTKGYLGIDGLAEFAAAARDLCLPAELSSTNRAVTVQTPGGTGGLRVAADFLSTKLPGRSIWCSQPTWANHAGVFRAGGLDVKSYTYLDAAGTRLDFAGMRSALQTIPVGDVVCLHACCHNPTGVDPSPDQWRQIAEIIAERKLLPLVDFAYQGFGDGLNEDAVGLHSLTQHVEELLICSSFSKNFGLYSERVGALTAVANSVEAAGVTLSHLKASVRANYSNPPRHGGAIVATVLTDAELRGQWESELADMRTRINRMRSRFVEVMSGKAPNHDFSFIANQRGMFSFSGLTPVQVDQLRSEYSIYIVGSGRINVAGMTDANLERLCDAIASVL